MLIRNSAIYMGATLLSGLFGLATTATLTRLLDPHEYGLYGLALVVMTLGSSVAFDWLGLSFIRFYQARRQDPRLLATFISIFFALCAISAGALGIALLGGLVPTDLVAVSILSLAMVWVFSWFNLVSRISVAEFQPLEYMKMNLGRSFLILAGATTAAWLTRNSLWTAVATAAGTFAGAFFGKIPIPRPSWRLLDRDLARDVLIFGIPLAASLVLFSLTDSGTRILLEQLDSAAALGVYTAASVLAQATLGVIAGGVSSAGYSLVVREIERGDHTAARRQLLANGTFLLAVLAPASLGIALTANSIATTLVGSKYVSGVAPLVPWMAMSHFFNCMGTHFVQAFQLGKRPHLQIWVAVVAGINAIGLSFYLIPRDGPVGAAIAVAATSVVTCVHSTVAGRYAYPIPLPISGAARVGVCCAIMALVVIEFPDSGWTGLALRAGFGAAAYALAAVALNLLDSRQHAIRLAKQAARWLAAFRSAAVPRKLR
jgi:O-antigen/teichoic acid export membrane protein